jgi:hypothetical protein
LDSRFNDNFQKFNFFILKVDGYREDECQIYADDGAINLSTIRRKLLNLIKAHPLKASVAEKMQRACWDSKFRADILFGRK